MPITKYETKGSALEWEELDGNWDALVAADEAEAAARTAAVSAEAVLRSAGDNAVAAVAAAALAAAVALLQPLDADLTAIAALTSAANKVPYATGQGTWALTDFTAAGRSLVGAADAAAQRTALGLGTAAVAGTGDFDATGTASSAVSTHAALQTGVHGISVSSGKTLSATNTLTFTGTDGSTLNVGAGGTLASAAFVALDTDTALAANSDTRVPSQKAVKAYIDGAVTGLLDFKGSIDASSNPNHPAASKGDAYYISSAGKVGGASGKSVDIGDVVVASADTAGGTEASVGASWFVLEHNLVGAVVSGGALGTPISGTLTNCSGLPLGGITGFGTGVATALAATPNASGGVLIYGTGATYAGTDPFTAAQTIKRDSIGVTTTDGLILTNTTAAAAGAQQWSPRLRLTAQGWKTNATAASQTIDWIIQNETTQGSSNPTSTLRFMQQVNGGGYVTKLSIDGVDGNLSIPYIAYVGEQLALGASKTIRFIGQTYISSASYGVVTITNELNSDSSHWSVPNLLAGTMQQGSTNSATPVAQTLRAQGSRSGTDTNVGGADYTIQCGQGTGTGTASSLIFKTPVVVASGTGAQTMTTTLTLNAGNATFPGTVTFSATNAGIVCGKGSAGAPGICINNSSSGFAYDTPGNELYTICNGTAGVAVLSTGVRLSDVGLVAWRDGAVSTGTSDLILRRVAAATLGLGSTDAASPVAQTVQAQGSRSGTDTNVGGASLTIQSGKGTGTGTASSLIFKTPVVVASGTGAQTMTTGATINSAGVDVGAGGLSFPTADPHIAGRWWDNAGTLTKSAG